MQLSALLQCFFARGYSTNRSVDEAAREAVNMSWKLPLLMKLLHFFEAFFRY